MVGRGVSAPRATPLTELASTAEVDPTSTIQALPSSAVDMPVSGLPVSAQEDLTYAKRLEAPEPPPEPAVEPVVAPVAAVVERKLEAPTPVPAAAREVERAPSEPKGDGFVVQVAAVSSRDEADAIARRLVSKGFRSFVTTPGPGTPRVYRVRVGKYTDRREAEGVARRLAQEEQFNPWITR